MKKTLFFALLFISAQSFSQSPIRYEFSFPNYVHHEAQVKLFLPQSKGIVNVRMSRSSPGRYATHEFGKNVYGLKAYDSASKRVLSLTQQAGDEYQVSAAGGTVVIEYTLYGDHVDGTYSAIDRNHAHLNMPASFLWAVGRDKKPIEVKFIVPEGLKWKVATQLVPGKDDYTFHAPDLQYLMDSPTEISDFKMRTWKVTDTNGKVKNMRIALHGDITDEVMDGYTEDVKNVVNEAAKVYGQLADYDYGTYTFIIDLMPKNNGDGMEHRNSTCITGRAGKLTKEVMKNELGVTSHEFFHSWNVERIRPKTIEPFNFTHANMSDELWIAEGFTQYYGELILTRAGFDDQAAFLNTIGFYLNGFTNNPGGKYRTPIQASRLAVYTDAGTAIDKTNFGNIFYSYYLYGASIATILDLTLRKDYNKTLDDFMRVLWRKYGKTGVPYTVDNLQTSLGEITNAGFAKQFFTDYVHGTKRPVPTDIFAAVGVSVSNPFAGKASLGSLVLKTPDGMGEVTNTIQQSTPLYEAGVENGDMIKQLDGKDIKSIQDINDVLNNKKPGDEMTISFNSRGMDVIATVKAKDATGLQLKVTDNGSEAQQGARSAWLGARQ